MSGLSNTQKLYAEKSRLEQMLKEENADVQIEKLLKGQSFSNGVLMHMATTNEALKRIDESIVDMKRDVADMKVNGLRMCGEHKSDMAALKANDVAQSTALNRILRNGNGAWLQVGNWKAAGIPAVILAIILGLAAYQRWETKSVAADINIVKEQQEVFVRKQAAAIVKMLLDEMKNPSQIRTTP
jgi:hypothetical protein